MGYAVQVTRRNNDSPLRITELVGSSISASRACVTVHHTRALSRVYLTRKEHSCYRRSRRVAINGHRQMIITLRQVPNVPLK